MNIQIFGKNKCFDTKKAERWFKERRIKFQSVDLLRYGISAGELASIIKAVGTIDELIDSKSPDAAMFKYMAYDQDKINSILDNTTVIRTPIVRNGKQATVGYCPEAWEKWE